MIPASRFEILIATHNPGKVREVEDALRQLPVKIRYLNEYSRIKLVDEVGESYEENAVLKALGYAKQAGVCALADDSGLEVDALGGAPGLYSARFGGENVSDDDRVQKLLAALSCNPSHPLTARFVCCIALATWSVSNTGPRLDGPQLLTVTQSTCEGSIALQPRGKNGFGFDPVFVPQGYSKTFAELPIDVKEQISHRAKALETIRTFLSTWLRQT